MQWQNLTLEFLKKSNLSFEKMYMVEAKKKHKKKIVLLFVFNKKSVVTQLLGISTSSIQITEY